MKTFIICLLFASALTTSLPAQSTSTPAANPDADASSNAQTRARRGNFNPADLQARMMTSLREQFAVKDDTEWSLIAQRITAVMDLRRTSAPAWFGGGGNRGNRPGLAVNPEQEALRTALEDNLPDAEITARLARLREMHQQNEAKLDKAREELRAVLTVRQEAVAVLADLLN